MHNGRPLFTGGVNVRGGGNTAAFKQSVEAAKGDILDFVLGDGGNGYGNDTTGLELVITSASGKVWNAATNFSLAHNPNGLWSYGMLVAGPMPDSSGFKLYTEANVEGARGGRIGTVSNPGSDRWEDLLDDRHPYQRTPHTANIIRTLRTISGGAIPMFISEYGVGSGVDLARVVRQYEQRGKANLEDALFYRDKLDRFMADWKLWQMADVFGRPEDFFAASLCKMAAERLLGLNAIRSNPDVVGYSLTGTVDQGMSGEGLTTTFRELKPGTVDALFDGWAPLRWCLFVEPVHFYRGQTAHLEAVLANEDQLAAGEYPALFQVFGPNQAKVWEKRTKVTIAKPGGKSEPAFALPVLAEDVVLDGPAGQYRFVATFERGAAAAGGEVTFFVADRAQQPKVDADVVLWGKDPVLVKWLGDRGITMRPNQPGEPKTREIILAGSRPPAPGGAEVFKDFGHPDRARLDGDFSRSRNLRQGRQGHPLGSVGEERFSGGTQQLAVPQGRMGPAASHLRRVAHGHDGLRVLPGNHSRPGLDRTRRPIRGNRRREQRLLRLLLRSDAHCSPFWGRPVHPHHPAPARAPRPKSCGRPHPDQPPVLRRQKPEPAAGCSAVRLRRSTAGHRVLKLNRSKRRKQSRTNTLFPKYCESL